MFSLQGQPLIILAAAAAHFIIGWLWYSDNLFGPMWKKLGGKCSGMFKDANMNYLASFVASIVLATAAFIAISIFQKTQVSAYAQEGFARLFGWFLQDNIAANNSLMCSVRTVAFLWAGFYMPISAKCVIWGGKHWKMWMITGLGELAGLIGIAMTIAYMS